MANANYNSAVLDGVRKFTTALIDMAGNFKAVISDLMGGLPRLDRALNHPVLADKRPITKRINFDSFRAVALITAASFVGGYLPVLADMVARISFRLIDSSAWKLLF